MCVSKFARSCFGCKVSLIKHAIGLGFIRLFLRLIGSLLILVEGEKKTPKNFLWEDSGILDDNSSGWAEEETQNQIFCCF